MTDPIVTHELSKQYRGFRALDEFSFSVPEGSIYGLLGENGAGKTTAIDLLMNLQTPTSGDAIVLGQNSRKLQGREFQHIGYVADNQDLPGWMTLQQLLRYLKPFYPSWDDQRASELVTQFRLPFDKPIRSFSRGMRMKAALTSSMAYRPQLLVLDEPFSGLDPLTREELAGALLETADAMTVLVSSHDIHDIETFVSHVGYLSHGRLEFSEELPALVGRFREIVVTVPEPVLPPQWPKHWLCAETTQSVVRFVESNFDPERTDRELRQFFCNSTAVDIAPVSLRAILVSLIRASGNPAQEASHE
jgi:ABC-2 type transport system ATP-binding protein